MKPQILYFGQGNDWLPKPKQRDIELLSRRSFVKRSSLFLPLAFVAGMSIKARATSTIQTFHSLNSIQMLNDVWARPITLPGGWSKIRFGLLINLAVNAVVNLTSDPRWAVGFCHGTSNVYGDASCDHFVGGRPNQSSWVYPGGPSLVCDFFGYKCVGTTETASSAIFGSNGLNVYTQTSSSTSRQLWFVDVTKGSPNYTINMWGSSGYADNAVSDFLTNLPLASPSATAGAPQTLAVNEGTDGVLNAVSTWWNRADYVMNICAHGVALLA